ncbi:MAG: hypothetical protein KC620_21720 [Myxococcales bacterium]|nr:hypothetical protein [Myxococcales bacterium]
MTALALQRVVVRMLYDPALVDAVYADVAKALVDVPLTAAEQSWLVAPDRRRWAADPLRRTRGLQALLEEFPVASALAAGPGKAGTLDAFFSTPTFHDCIQQRGSLAMAFAAFLAAHGTTVTLMARIEQAIARVRRAPARPAIPPTPTPASLWGRAPWADGFFAPEGALAAWQAADATLRGHAGGPVAALLDPVIAIAAPELDPADHSESLLVERAESVGLSIAGEGLIEVLVALARPQPWAAAAAALRAAGADPGEESELAAELLADGLLTLT